MSANGSSSSPTISASSVGFSHNILASSISSSLSAASRPSHISKTYRQASTLFLTRRLPEALTTLLPLITPPEPVDDGEPAPVARASRTTRVKVWSLYLTILNAILEMEADEGKDAFGTQEWRAICNKVREGEVWDEVIRNGYHGVEGDVDSDVVINLATLLLAHARDQTLNQKKLEAFLAASNTPNLDLAGRLAGSSPERRMSNRYRSPVKGTSGANTPRDLNARVKILELYTLHVLLRNNEWDYAREFISVSSVLDEERREAFLQALQSLQEEQQEQERLEKEERQRQEDQLRKDIEEAKKLRAENEERERRRLEEERARREGSEIDYGIDETRSHTGSSSKSRHARTHSNASRQSKSSSTSASGFRQNGKAVTRPTLTSRASMVVTRLRTVVEHLSKLLNGNPMLLVRFLAFLIGLILMLSHKGVRARVQRILTGSWNKLKATAGMGVKVSYM